MCNTQNFTQEVIIENQILQFVHNQTVNGEEVSTLLQIYFLVKAGNVLGLTEFLAEYLKDSNILARLEALENGETGLLTDNPNLMDFGELGNIDMVRGIYDAEQQRFYC